MTKHIAIERQGPLGLVILNRPDRHNAFDDALIAELTEALRSMEAEDGIRAVVLSSVGRSFSAGADLNWMRRVAGASMEENKRDAMALAAVSAVALAVVLIGSLTRLNGAIMVLLLFTYIYVSYVTERAEPNGEAQRHEDEAAMHAPARDGAVRFLLIALAALVGVVIGARLLVDSAIVLAHQFGVPETVIGLTVVAIGTSLPELAVSAIAAFRGQGAVAVGNVVGSNIYNVLGILGLTALVHPLAVPPEIARFDIWVLLGSAAALLYFMVGGRTIGRVAGGLLLAAYAAYVAWLF